MAIDQVSDAIAPDPAPVDAGQPAAQTEATQDAAPDATAEAITAFREGVEASNKQEFPDAEPAKAVETKPADAKAAAVAEETKPDAVEDEIKALGLKDKTAERFRELSKRPSEADIAPIRAKAERADAWEKYITDTGATPEQFGNTVAYTALAVRANAGDVEAAKAAYDATSKEMEHWAKMLGREVPGKFDPLAAHADLQKEVTDGDLTRARALEIANQRAVVERSTQFNQSQQAEQQRQQQHALAIRQAVDVDIAALNQRLVASDPAFLQKLPMLQPALNIIKETLPPNQWAQAVERAYMALPQIAAPAAKPSVSAVPLRPTGSSSSMQREPQSDLEAFRMGVAAAG